MQRSVGVAVICSGLMASIALAEAVRIDPNGTVMSPRQPQAAVAPDGTIYVAFGARNTVYCAVSENGGKTFSAPAKVADLRSLMLGMRRGPRVAASATSVAITAIGKEGDLLCWQSEDHGQSWSGSTTVNSAAGSAREGLHAMAAGPNGELYCVWLDLRSRKTEIYGAASTNGGNSWAENQLIYRSPGGSVCECCHPSVAFDTEGGIHVMWRNSIEGKRDLYRTRSAGTTSAFEQALKLGTGTWPLDACPMDGGSLAVSSPEKVTTIWRRRNELFRTSPGPNTEESLGSGEQPWAAGTADGAWLVWLRRRPGDLWIQAPGARPAKLATGANDPVIAAPFKAAGPVVAAWESGRDQQSSIFVNVLRSK